MLQNANAFEGPASEGDRRDKYLSVLSHVIAGWPFTPSVTTAPLELQFRSLAFGFAPTIWGSSSRYRAWVFTISDAH
jgi:hypothetical protein